MLQLDVVTIFPAMFDAVVAGGVTGRARDRGVYQLVAWNPRDFAQNAYRTVDDRPYGGGPGMVMRADVAAAAIDAVRKAGVPVVAYGSFITVCVNFLIRAFIIFLRIKQINKCKTAETQRSISMGMGTRSRNGLVH